MWVPFAIMNAKLIGIESENLKFSVEVLNSNKEWVDKEFELTFSRIDFILDANEKMVVLSSLNESSIGQLFTVEVSKYIARKLGLCT